MCHSNCCEPSSCCGARNLCAPIIPPSPKAESYRIALIVISVLHFGVFLFKTYMMGIMSGFTDLIAISILWVALIRFDYC